VQKTFCTILSLGSERITSKLAGSAAAFYGAAHLSSTNTVTLRARQLLDLKAITDANGYETITWNNAPPSAANCTGLSGEALKQCQCQNGACTDLMYFFHPDHIGSSSFLSDINGQAYEFLLYLPYGEVVADQKAGGGQYSTPYKFTGKELDAETGLYYYGARYYDPSLGIFHGVDPLASKYPGWSPYNYTMNNPIGLVDKDGREPSQEGPGDPPSGIWGTLLSNLYQKWEGVKKDIFGSREDQPTNGEIYRETIATGKRIEKVAEYQTMALPGGSLLNPNSSNTDKGLDLASSLLPFGKMGKPGAKIGKEVVENFVESAAAKTGGQGFKSLGAAGRGFSEVLQKGGQAIKNSTWKRLGIDPIKGGEAIHGLKKANNLKPNFHGKIMGNGDYLHPETGEFIDNIFDYLH
jgi:RHS repeat-associated protein